MNMKIKISLVLTSLLICGCSLSPGMHMNTKSSWLDESVYVSVDSIEKDIELINISESQELLNVYNYIYKIGVGDQIAVTVWGLPEIFPVTNISPDQNLRRVDANGNIFFPYVGLVEAAGKTQDELRKK